jgi:hypothetical protein
MTNKIAYIFAVTMLLIAAVYGRTNAMGLQAEKVSIAKKDFIEIWIPFRIESDCLGKNLVYFMRRIPLSSKTADNIRSALTELLNGPNESEKEKGAIPLVNEAKILSVRIKWRAAIVDFSKEFAPAGGSLAIWHSHIAVEEILRQFPEIKKVDILIEGIPAIESLQP